MKVQKIFECGSPRNYNLIKMYQVDGDSKKQKFADFLPHIDFNKVEFISELSVHSTEYRKYYSFEIGGENSSIDVTVELHWGYADYDSRKVPVETNSSQMNKLYKNIVNFWKSI